MVASPITLPLDAFLEDLARRIDPATEEALLHDWQVFWENGSPEPLFCPSRPAPAPPGIEWPDIRINDTLGEVDIDRMVLSQLKGCSSVLASAGGSPLTVRSNYGVGILATLFGAELFIMPPEQNCLPNVRPVGADAMRAALDRGVPDLHGGLGGRVFEAGQRVRELFAPHPQLARHIHIYHPDLQGPMDICELLWGSDIFLDLYDESELVHDALSLICETYETFMQAWWTLVPPEEPLSFHWFFAHRGRIVIRDDSAMNLSPEMFDEFILPYDQRLLNRLGGGGIHACGRVDHYIDRMPRLPGLTFFNMSQSSYNDMETVYTHTVDSGIHLLGLDRATAEQALAAGRDFSDRVHCG